MSEQDITDFVGRASTDAVTRQLLQIIINDITSSGTIRPREVVTDFSIEDGEDVYGDYDFLDEDDMVDEETIIKENIVDINNAAEVINKLKSVFL